MVHTQFIPFLPFLVSRTGLVAWGVSSLLQTEGAGLLQPQQQYLLSARVPQCVSSRRLPGELKLQHCGWECNRLLEGEGGGHHSTGCVPKAPLPHWCSEPACNGLHFEMLSERCLMWWGCCSNVCVRTRRCCNFLRSNNRWADIIYFLSLSFPALS